MKYYGGAEDDLTIEKAGQQLKENFGLLECELALKGMESQDLPSSEDEIAAMKFAIKLHENDLHNFFR